MEIEDEKWVIIADIVNSKKIKNRDKIQLQLENTISEINHSFSKYIEKDFKITLGDEFIGVLKNTSKLIEIILKIIFQLKSINLRFGISIVIEEKENSDDTNKNARKAIKKAEKNDYPIYFSNIKNEKYRVIIALTLLLFIYYFNQYTDRQKTILYYLIKGNKQKNISQKLNISQSAVSQAVKKVNWRLLRTLYNEFEKLPIYYNNKSSKSNKELNKYIALIGCWNYKMISKKRMSRILKNINNNHKNTIQGDFVQTVPVNENSYEFQGLLKNNDELFTIIIEFIYNINNFHLGIGIGSLNTEKKDLAIGMDGPAFYKARNALEKAKENNNKIQFIGKYEKISSYISILILLFFNIVDNWTVKQLEAVRLKKRRFTHNEIGQKLNKSRTAIINRLQRVDWKTILYIENMLKKLVK